jgi:hypothetical protein
MVGSTRLGAKKDRFQVHVHNMIPVRLFHVDDQLGIGASRDVDENIEFSPTLHCRPDHFLHGFLVRYVNDDGKGIAASTRDFDGALFSAFRVDVGDGDFRAFAGKMARNGAANAASATGDDCNSVI